VRCAEAAQNGEASTYVINAQGPLLVGDPSQRNQVQQLHQPALHLKHALIVKSGERTTNGLQLYPEIAPDFLARPSQHKLA
jgi:hypothetical protein